MKMVVCVLTLNDTFATYINFTGADYILQGWVSSSSERGTGLWETLPKLSMEHVTDIGPGHQGAKTVMMGIHQLFGQ